MALLFMDGFDHYATADIVKKWSVNNGATIEEGTGRRGGNALKSAAGSGFVSKTLPFSVGTLICGFAFSPITAGFSDRNMFELMDGATLHLALRHNASTGMISVLLGSTVIATTTTSIAVASGYAYVEFKATIHDTTGAYELRINGVPALSASGIDTRNAGNASVNAVRIGNTGTNGHISLFDDFYACDSAGLTNNDFLGDVRIDTIFPNGAGTHQSWTPSTGTDHAALVDETAPNTTDYLTGGAAGTKETLGLQDLSVNGAILGIQVNNAVSKTDAGACTIKNLIRSGSSEASGQTFAPSTSYLYSSSIHEADPATGAAWLTAAINALEAGAEVVS
ncbi:hypothetical protein U5817_10060 [Aromatoleum evansii]|uniref:Uncharacterized protein n=1 Tax=Aromatoleum evansii TaxID=59406 RepID=A0ABZ1AUR2_AROEV|nr:hypothetical protein U5817_09710 [Aromatoleum evansii]WRL48371.1 hypothetical protein U5817_10060 [Aromatoleum evansii]